MQRELESTGPIPKMEVLLAAAVLEPKSLTQHSRKVFKICDVLHDGNVDSSAFLVELFVTPVRIVFFQLVTDLVVQNHKDHVHQRQARQLVAPAVTFSGNQETRYVI